MAIDPNIALGFRGVEAPNPLTAYAQAAQIQNAQNQNALAQYQLSAAQRKDTAEEALNSLYAKHFNPATGAVNMNALASDLAAAGQGAQIPVQLAKQQEMQTKAAALQKTNLEAADQQRKLIAQAQRDISSRPSDANITAYLEDIQASPLFNDQQKAAAAKEMKDLLAMPMAKRTEFLSTKGATASDYATMRGQNMTDARAREQLKLQRDRLNAEMATGELTPQTVDFVAETYRQTGQLPPLGMGKAAVNMRQKILERAAQLSMAPTGAAPLTAAEAAAEVKANKAETAGLTAGQRAVGTQIANTQVAASEANKMINVAKPYVDKVNPTDYPVLNAAGNFVARNTGDPNVVGLATALNGLVNTYARAINPKGVATVSDKNHAREIINAAMSKGQINEAFTVMGQEMEAALASGPETRAALRPNKPAAAGAGVDLTNPLLKP